MFLLVHRGSLLTTQCVTSRQDEDDAEQDNEVEEDEEDVGEDEEDGEGERQPAASGRQCGLVSRASCTRSRRWLGAQLLLGLEQPD